MPLVKNFTLNNQTHIIVWKIEEEFEQFDVHEDIKQSPRRNEKMAVRFILNNFFKGLNLAYDKQGKPLLVNSEKYISISHSKDFVVVAIGNSDVGVDIELISDKAARVSRKFIHEQDLLRIPLLEEQFFYTLIWSAKEVVFKKYSHVEHLIFSQQIVISKINVQQSLINVIIEFEDKRISQETLSYSTIEDFILVYSN